MSIRLMLLCAAVCGSTLFFNACATKEAVPPQPEKKSTPVPVKAEKKQAPLPRKAEKKDALVPVAPVNGAQVSLLNAGQKAFLNMPRAERTAFFADPAKRKQLKKNGLIANSESYNHAKTEEITKYSYFNYMLKSQYAALDKAVKAGAMHKNQANRKKSRLGKLVAKDNSTGETTAVTQYLKSTLFLG